MKSLLISCCAGVSGGMYFGHFGAGAACNRPPAVAAPLVLPFTPSPFVAARGRSCRRGGAGASGGCDTNGDVRGMVAIVLNRSAGFLFRAPCASARCVRLVPPPARRTDYSTTPPHSTPSNSPLTRPPSGLHPTYPPLYSP